MCLITNQQEPKVLKKDLIVYKKVIEKITKPLTFSSSIQFFEWIPGVIYKSKLRKVPKHKRNECLGFDDIVYNAYYKREYGDYFNYIFKSKKTIAIDLGFHAALSRKRLEINYFTTNKNIYKFLIPKGSLYYKDSTGLIVADTMMMLTMDQQWKDDNS